MLVRATKSTNSLYSKMAKFVSDLPLWLLLLCAWIAPSFPSAVQKSADRCLELADPGPCKFFELKWHWDEQTHHCRQFNYGGCLGNRNRFNSKEACRRECLHKVYDQSIPALCLEDVDPGYCRVEDSSSMDSVRDVTSNAQWWYYFDANAGICEQFLFFGCTTGNNNRFYSLYQCRSVCGGRLESEIACDKCDVRTSYCKFFSKYNSSCECRHGYRKLSEIGECTDVDECEEQKVNKHNCDENATCKNKPGSYACECMAGYVGNGNQCTFVGVGSPSENCSNCSPNATCLAGKSICQCKFGFSGDGFKCTDVDECRSSANVCDKNAKCRNTIGSFTCECRKGFAGNGYSCTKDKASCLERFDPHYRDKCGHVQEARQHYYLDHETKQCAMFWYNGCTSPSSNIFSTLSTCQSMCQQSTLLHKADTCWDKFDLKLRNQCLKGDWQQRYYFDHASMTCQLFWWDGCRSEYSRNYFNDLLSCQWMCEQQQYQQEQVGERDRAITFKAKACLEPFDQHYRDECTGGQWRKHFFFDNQQLKRCLSFWYDGCTGQSQNIFQDEATCVATCETPTDAIDHSSRMMISLENANIAKSPAVQDSSRIQNEEHILNKPTTTPKPTTSIKPTMKVAKSSSKPATQVVVAGQDVVLSATTVLNSTLANICETRNPCQNNATCVFDRSKESFYYCRCAPGYTNDNCTEKSDFDPCSSSPCLNGGTCSAKADKNKSTFECFCSKGFAGVNCELRPCDNKPCQNNGTCRTTKGTPPFFCECTPEWGGRDCAIEIPQDPNKRKYGKSVQLLSSGKVEWIKEMQKIGPTEQNPPDVPNPNTPKNVSIAANINSKEENNSRATVAINSGSVEVAGIETRRSSSPISANVAPIVGSETPTRTLSKSAINGGFTTKFDGAINLLISISFHFTLIRSYFRT